jgi:hypothetical protein
MEKIVLKPRKERDKKSTEDAILLLLATDAPKSRWGIKNILRKSYGNVHETVKVLLTEYLINKVKSNRSSKNPKLKVDYYDLTNLGLLRVLSNSDASESIDKIAEKHKDKLLLFRKWPFFRQTGRIEFIKTMISHFPRFHQSTVRLASLLGTAEVKIGDKQAEEMINSWVFGLFMWNNPNVSIKENQDLFAIYWKIWEVCKQESELKEFLEEHIKQFRQYHLSTIDQINNLEEEWKTSGCA